MQLSHSNKYPKLWQRVQQSIKNWLARAWEAYIELASNTVMGIMQMLLIEHIYLSAFEMHHASSLYFTLLSVVE